MHFLLRNQQLVVNFDLMKRILFFAGIIFFISTQSAKAQFETSRDSVVQLYGVVMTADSLVGIPAVSVVVKGQNRGTMSNAYGVFSIVVLKGDEIEFTHVSYKPKKITIPKNLEGNQYSIVQLMVADTVYLPSTIIKPRPTHEKFARDLVNIKVDDDQYEIARKNMSEANRRAWMRSVSGDAGEATKVQMNKIANQAVYRGQTPPISIFNPAAWAEFINSWKRGDFKNKN